MKRIGAALDLIADGPGAPDTVGTADRLRGVVGRFGVEVTTATGGGEVGRPNDAHALLIGWNRALLERRVAAVGVVARSAVETVDAADGAMGRSDPFAPDHWALIPLGRSVGDLTSSELAVLKLLGTLVEGRPTEIAEAPKGRVERPLLSRRERECLQWTAAGKTTWEISTILEISQNTIDGYIASATKKLGAVNRTQAVAEALRRALID